ncbi:14993_t:CDS:2 [Rhizophagus irregularis]|nr:14993_t:CDS:2 [Rhizophagus irregularis]
MVKAFLTLYPYVKVLELRKEKAAVNPETAALTYIHTMNNVNEEDYDGDNKVWDGDEVDSDDDYCPFFYEDNLQRQKRKSYITAFTIDLTKIISMQIL